MANYKKIKNHNWRRQEKFAVATALIALAVAVAALIISLVTNAKPQSQAQFTPENAKQILEIEKLPISTAQHKESSLPSVPASGHVTFLQSYLNDGPSFTNDHPVRVKLNVESYHRGVNVSEEGIKILYSGIYFVYTSVHYKLATRKCSEISYQQWFLYVFRHNLVNDLDTLLLKSIYHCCEECSQVDETKFIAGLFYLESGDLISVMSSGQNLFSGSRESSFLGLVMLSSGQTVTS